MRGFDTYYYFVVENPDDPSDPVAYQVDHEDVREAPVETGLSVSRLLGNCSRLPPATTLSRSTTRMMTMKRMTSRPCVVSNFARARPTSSGKSPWRSHTVRNGKIGTGGQSHTKSFDSEEEASNDYARLIAEKVKKGYLELG